MHILNFCTTLTPATALARHNTHSPRINVDVPPAPRVDYTTPALTSVLASLAEVSSTNSTDVSVYLKIAPPVHIRVTPAPQPSPSNSLSSLFVTNTEASTKERAGTGQVIENFMSSWTTLVGDPVMSKWIVVFLAISVTLNGLLLKGIAAGTGLPIRGSVRFRSRVGIKFNDKGEDEASEPVRSTTESAVGVMPRVEPVLVAAPASNPGPEPVPAAVPTIVPMIEDRQQEKLSLKRAPLPVLSIAVDLDTVDAKLEKERQLAEALARAERSRTEETRSLAEIVDVFENGPRPVSASLSLLTDEEVVLLCQNGKIAAYALEKMLGDFERAVVIRRALICMFRSRFVNFEDVC